MKEIVVEMEEKMENKTGVMEQKPREKRFLGIIEDEIECLRSSINQLSIEVANLFRVSGAVSDEKDKDEAHETTKPTEAIIYSVRDLNTRIQKMEADMKTINDILIT